MRATETAQGARNAFYAISSSEAEKRNKALERISKSLVIKKAEILHANKKDLGKAKGKISSALSKRLLLNKEKIEELRKMVDEVAELPDPLGKTISSIELDSGLELYQITVPLGVVCVIFESRPDALIQISSLAIKTGNSCILKGGSEAAETNKVLGSIVRDALTGIGLPEDAVQLVETRSDIEELLKLDEYIDLIIPRGSNELVKYIKERTKIPVLGHASGICHEYVDEYADIGKAVKITYDAKVQYPAVCNAMETLLVHEKAANEFLPKIMGKFKAEGVEVFADGKARDLLKKHGFSCREANEQSWSTEYSDLKLNLKIVNSLDDAISHINTHGSKHTDGIVTENKQNALRFLRKVDSASVFWNASTRFSDGYRYGKGAEVGISTNKIHARGPAGMESLLTYKYVLVGKGQVVADYSGRKAKPFTHKTLNNKFDIEFGI